MNKAENNKRIIKNTLLLYFRMLITLFVSFYTSRILLNALGVDDYGIYNVVGGIIIFLAFVNKAMSLSTLRYLTYEIGQESDFSVTKVFNTSFQIHLLISLLVLILGESIGLWFFYTQMNIPIERLNAAFWVYQFSVFSTMIIMINVPYYSLIIAHEKMSFFAYVSIIDVFLKLLIVYIIIDSPADRLILYSFLIMLTTIINILIYKIYCNRKFKESKLIMKFDKPLFKEMMGFAGWSLFGNLASVSSTQGLNILLNIFFGTAINAARGIAVQVQSAVAGFVGNFQTALNPQITKSYSSKDISQMHNLIYKSSKYSFFLLFIICVPIIMRTEQILLFWLKLLPEHTANFVRIVLMISLIDSLANPIMTSAAATGKIKLYQMLVGSILLLILPVSYCALKFGFNPESVFIIYLIFTVIAQIARLIIIQPMINLSLIEYIKQVAKPIFMVLIVSSIPLYFFNNILSNDFSGLVINTIIAVSFVIVVIYFMGFNENEKRFIMSYIKRKIRIRK